MMASFGIQQLRKESRVRAVFLRFHFEDGKNVEAFTAEFFFFLLMLYDSPDGL